MSFKVGILVLCQFFWATENPSNFPTPVQIDEPTQEVQVQESQNQKPQEMIGTILGIHKKTVYRTINKNGKVSAIEDEDTILEVKGKTPKEIHFFINANACVPVVTKEMFEQAEAEELKREQEAKAAEEAERLEKAKAARVKQRQAEKKKAEEQALIDQKNEELRQAELEEIRKKEALPNTLEYVEVPNPSVDLKFENEAPQTEKAEESKSEAKEKSEKESSNPSVIKDVVKDIFNVF